MHMQPKTSPSIPKPGAVGAVVVVNPKGLTMNEMRKGRKGRKHKR